MSSVKIEIKNEVEKQEDYCYIGLTKCNCLVAISCDMPGHEKGTAEDVADMIKSGLRVERATVDYAKNNFGRCTHEPKQFELFK
jgi:hypothetical protein